MCFLSFLPLRPFGMWSFFCIHSGIVHEKHLVWKKKKMYKKEDEKEKKMVNTSKCEEYSIGVSVYLCLVKVNSSINSMQ